MSITTTVNEMEAKSAARRKSAFDRWMDQPATRMMMSMIPAAEKREVLETLLQETFNSGFQAGAGETAGSFMEVIFKSMEKRAGEK